MLARLLDHEGKLFGAILGVLAVDQLLVFVRHVQEYWIYLLNGIYDGPMLSLTVTLLSALYMTIAAYVLFTSGRPLKRYETLLPNAMAVTGGFGIYAFGWLTPAEENVFGLYIPFVLLIAGVALVLWAFWYLRRAFSLLPQARTVVIGGPYSLIRHPMYAGNILTLAGLGLLLGTPAAILLAIALSGLQIVRTLYEDRIMAKTFPEYGDYMRQTNAFFPRKLGSFLCRSACVAMMLVSCTGNWRANAQSKVSPAERASINKKCETWHHKATEGLWFTNAEFNAFTIGLNDNAYESEVGRSGSNCALFQELYQTCDNYRGMVYDKSPEDEKKPTKEYVDANIALMRAADEIRGCKAIVGITMVCTAIRISNGIGGVQLSANMKSVLQQCSNAALRKSTSGLERGAL